MRHVAGLIARSLGRRFVALMVAFSFLMMEQANAAQSPAPAGQQGAPVEMGLAFAAASAKGYGGGVGEPYHGYIYKRLNEEGSDRQGGAKNYIVNGKLSGGFALIAFPAKYGSSRIMTFLVNQDGVIFQKDLGDDTETVAKGISSFNPDESWTVVE